MELLTQQMADAVLSLAGATQRVAEDVGLLREELKYTRYMVERSRAQVWQWCIRSYRGSRLARRIFASKV
jgi:hypothetical protein